MYIDLRGFDIRRLHFRRLNLNDIFVDSTFHRQVHVIDMTLLSTGTLNRIDKTLSSTDTRHRY